LSLLPGRSFAEERVPGYQGMFSNRLNQIIDGNMSRVADNISTYDVDHSGRHLDDSYDLIMQTADEIANALATAAGQVVKIPADRREEKVRAQIDKLEVINIRDIQLPVLCDRLFQVGRLYLNSDRNKARNCFSYIVTRFTSYESESCRNAAGTALDRMLTDK
jgi:hypothetical protein